MNEPPRSGVIVLDKPGGLPSNRVLGALKRILGAGRRDKIGFLGTLDPLATGVLPVFWGKATKLVHDFEGLEKTYRATVRLGEATDTYDGEGAVTARHGTAHLEPAAVRAAVQALAGSRDQRVPPYSAVKIAGVPAYRLARQGREVPERRRPVVIRAVIVERVEGAEVVFTLTCSAGTYVRSLAHELGEKLGVGAHLAALRRLACGRLFTLENSFTLDGIEACLASGDWGFLANPAEFLPQYSPLTVEEAAERQLREGRTIPLANDSPRLQPAAKVKALRPCGTLIAIGEVVRTRHDALGFQPSKVLV
jgi:tRNA pseudouridine55 synthase